MALTDLEMAKISYTMARKVTTLAADVVNEAVFWVSRGRTYLKGRYSYDPDLVEVDLAENFYIAYAAAKILGVAPEIDPEIRQQEDLWAKSSAMKHYKDHPGTYPEHPNSRMRIYRHSQKASIKSDN